MSTLKWSSQEAEVIWTDWRFCLARLNYPAVCRNQNLFSASTNIKSRWRIERTLLCFTTLQGSQVLNTSCSFQFWSLPVKHLDQDFSVWVCKKTSPGLLGFCMSMRSTPVFDLTVAQQALWVCFNKRESLAEPVISFPESSHHTGSPGTVRCGWNRADFLWAELWMKAAQTLSALSPQIAQALSWQHAALRKRLQPSAEFPFSLSSLRPPLLPALVWCGEISCLTGWSVRDWRDYFSNDDVKLFLRLLMFASAELWPDRHYLPSSHTCLFVSVTNRASCRDREIKIWLLLVLLFTRSSESWYRKHNCPEATRGTLGWISLLKQELGGGGLS